MTKEAVAGITAAVALSVSAGALVPAPRKLVKGEGSLAVKADICATARFEKDASIPREGYRLSVTKEGVTVVSSDDAGRYYALQTLVQLADGEREIQAVEIEDSPRYSWRGVHLDECRHFFGKETVKQVLDLMAFYKLNRFHWHLTEDQGWRIDVPGYP